MGFKQTAKHRFGKGSYHQIGLVRGQFGNVPFDQWVSFLKDTGFDGWEEASWELDLSKCDTDAGAEAYAKERATLAKSRSGGTSMARSSSASASRRWAHRRGRRKAPVRPGNLTRALRAPSLREPCCSRT